MSVPFYNLLFNLCLDPEAGDPMYLQVAAKVAEVIAAGKVQPGAPMPGTRTLAKALGISRNAAIAAYGELHDQGWIETEVGFGTRVARELPEAARGQVAPLVPLPTACAFELPKAEEPLPVFPALADPRLLPEDEVSRAFRRALGRLRPETKTPDPKGCPAFRECLSELLAARRALGVDPDSLLLVGGTLQALDVAARTLLQPGDPVVVEQPGNPAAWEVFRRAGARLLPVEVDGDGLRTDLLEDLCTTNKPRFMYLTPNAQWPTTGIMSEERRAAVIELAARYRMAILEDDHDAELYYAERAWAPLAARDRRGVVIHVGTFEHLLAPGLGVAHLTGPRDFVERAALTQQAMGRNGVDLAADTLRELVLDGTYLRHVRKVRITYRERRDRLVERLSELFGPGCEVPVPLSGLALWCRLPEGMDPKGLVRAGLPVQEEARFRLDGAGGSHLRLPFGPLV